MSQVYIGLIQPFAFPFAPRGWKHCDGALLSIAQYQALFSLIGVTYGGNAQTNFAVPDTRGRALLGQGNFLGQQYVMGQVSGVEAATLGQQNLPAHTHPLAAVNRAPTQSAPATGDLLSAASASNSVTGDAVTIHLYAPAGAAQPLQGVAPSGNSMPVPVMQPYLVNNYSIAVQGIFPSRN